MYKNKYFQIFMLSVCCMVLTAGCGHKKQKAKKVTATKAPVETTSGAEDTPDVQDASEEASDEETQVLEDSGDAEEEAGLRNTIAEELPFTAGDDKVCAVVYLGKGEAVQQQQLQLFAQKYLSEAGRQTLENVPHVDAGGEEAYLVVPRYKDCQISVNLLKQSSDGRVEVQTDAAAPEGAFVIYCNRRSDFADTEINVAYHARVHVIMPRISAVDNRMEMTQVALDLTDESVYGS